MKKFIIIGLLLLITCKNNLSNIENTSTNMSDNVTKNSPEPTQISEKSKNNSILKRKKVDMIYGKWKILDMVGYGYIYGDVSLKNYVGGVVTIHDNYIESNLPMGKIKLKNPKYKSKKQNKDDFWEYRHANIDNGFGFKSNQIKLIEVYDGSDEWDEFGGTFWIRDKKHLIFWGPVYFLAKKIE